MIPQDILDMASQKCFDAGVKLLQGHRLADTDADHIARLLALMNPPANSLWLDVGSGFGEAARLMCEARPDLSFMLVNNNQYQIDHTPTDFRTAHADMHHLPFGEETFDGCMFLWSLCHADAPGLALLEAARVTRPGGKLFVFDFDRWRGNNELAEQHFFARMYPLSKWFDWATAAGWKTTGWNYPEGSDAVFRAQAGDEKLYDRIFAEVLPVIWHAVRR